MALSRVASAFVLTLALALPAVSSAQSGAAFAKSGSFGLGLGGGSLTSGLSGKLYLSDRFGVQALVGLWAGLGVSAGVDGILEMAPLWQNDALSLNWNVGAGASFLSGSIIGTTVGVSGVVGLGAQLKDYPVELTSEFRPTLLLGSSILSGLYWGGGGAIRYYFM